VVDMNSQTRFECDFCRITTSLLLRPIIERELRITHHLDWIIGLD
jgi:hypothetical protein